MSENENGPDENDTVPVEQEKKPEDEPKMRPGKIPLPAPGSKFIVSR